MVTEMVKVLPVSTGFGVMVTAEITGAAVSRVTVLVTVVDLPALSVDTMVIVFAPLASVSTLLKVPSALTVTAAALPLLSLTVTVHGLDVASLVVPDTVQDALFVIRLLVGLVTDRVGGTVSTLKVTDFWVAALPSKSFASILIVWLPSARADVGV